MVIVQIVCLDDSQESERAALDKEHQNIISFVKTGSCNDNSDCRYVGAGSKPCGGNRSYVVYPVSFDTVRLFQMVSDYTSHEAAYNRKWGLVSDCLMPPPPDSMRCVNGRCVGYWNGVAR